MHRDLCSIFVEILRLLDVCVLLVVGGAPYGLHGVIPTSNLIKLIDMRIILLFVLAVEIFSSSLFAR